LSQSVVLGRSAACQVEIADDFASREHAEIAWDRDYGGYVLRDLGSRNGTFVNDQRVEEHLLRPGEQIRVGSHIFKFLSADHVEAQYHETVYQMMTVDALTQIHNRRYFEDAFERELSRSLRHGRPLMLLVIDLDRFKNVNDELGHVAGDEVLRGVCQRIKRRVRRDELFARFGGEEFVILLTELSAAQGRQVAEELRNVVAESPISTSRGPVQQTISIGAAHTSGLVPITSQELLNEADRQLYQAKSEGRNCVRC
jgi:diguanylate cyclase (GGDEF)-like protein